ncbi:hypothetical protein ACP275_13G028300 [Erythranthe tilingii]
MNTFTGFFLCTLLTLAIISIPITLTLTTNVHRGPRFYVKEFYVPALDLSQLPTTSNNNNNNKNNSINNSIITNPCLFFDLAFFNIEDEHSVRYGDVNLTFSYGSRNNTVANYVVGSFDQGWLEVDYRREVVESHGVPWEDAVKAVSNGSTVVFRVDLAARPKFWEGWWYSKKKGVRIGADVEVDGTGLKVKKKDIRLNSAASQRGVGIYVLFLSLLVAWECLFF